MTSAFSTKAKLQSPKGETLLLQTDLSKSNAVTTRSIKWDDITLPKKWHLEGAIAPH